MIRERATLSTVGRGPDPLFDLAVCVAPQESYRVQNEGGKRRNTICETARG